jgi:probable LLM family oxidoreductase
LSAAHPLGRAAAASLGSVAPASVRRIELGICRFVFADHGADDRTGASGNPFEAALEEIELADSVGIDVFGVGEHHAPEFLDSAPQLLLAAAAARTRNIRLTSAATILGVADPVRLFEEFATLDVLSNGRAEIIAGRGSAQEPFRLFGLELRDYDDLYSEKLRLLLALRANPVVRWTGRHRAPLLDQGVYPRPVQRELPIWVGVGGSPSSASRAGALGLPMALGVLGGEYGNFRPFVDLYREAGARAGHPPDRLRVCLNAIGYVGKDQRAASEEFFPPYQAIFGEIARKANWPAVTRERFERLASPKGALVVGGPHEVAEKIAYADRVLGGIARFNLQMSVGPVDYAKRLRSIELLGGQVRRRLAERPSPQPRAPYGPPAETADEPGAATSA